MGCACPGYTGRGGAGSRPRTAPAPGYVAMQQRDGRLFLSPSDLNNFLACEHRTALDLARARGEILLQRSRARTPS